MRRLSSRAKRNSPAISEDNAAGSSRQKRNSRTGVNYSEEETTSVKDVVAEGSFEVEAVVDSRFIHGKHQYKIRWKGYGPEGDTWENEDNLDCPELIADFQKETIKEENKEQKKQSIKEQTKGKKRSSLTAAKSAGSPTKKKSKKSANETHNGDSADSSDDTEWEVSKIVDYAELKDGTRQFLVRWKGYSSKHDSWEPEAHLNCLDLIEKFLSQEKKREEVDREFREVRKQVNRYNPQLSKRHSHRASAKKSDGVLGLDIQNTYRQLLDEESSSESSRYNSAHVPRKESMKSSQSNHQTQLLIDSGARAAWHSWLSQRCSVM